MLHLQSCVHLHEVELAIGSSQELHRSSAGVADGRRCGCGAQAQALALILRESGAGRLLDQLLMVALDRALSVAEVDCVAKVVGQDLDLDVAATREVAFQVEGAIAEGGLGLRRRLRPGLR